MSINKSPLYIASLVTVIVMVIIIRHPQHLAILRRRFGELQHYLLILLLLRRKEIVWWIWWVRHALLSIISLSKITAQTGGGCSWQVRVKWIWRKIDLLPHILMFHCLQTIWVSFFIAKITNIRSKLDGILPSHPPLSTPEPNLESESGDIVFSHFQCQAWLR